MPSVETLKMGTEYAPDESATMVREVSLIEVGVGMTLTGPGIQTETRLMVPELDTAFAQTRSEIASLLPRGVDIFLTCANQLCGLPRSTRIGV
jgi:alpha-D-ribose 1-methylphosphonate 5-triphosphate synthase subunit PhnH